MTKNKDPDDKLRYPMFSCRLSEDVQEQLKTAKLKSEKSWNLFIKDLFNQTKERKEKQ